MAFGIDDAAVVVTETAGEAATEETVSEVGSSVSSSLESISENSLSEEFSPVFFSESSSSDFLEKSSPETDISLSECETQLPNTIEEEFSPSMFDEPQDTQLSCMRKVESTPTQEEVTNSELDNANSSTEKLEEPISEELDTDSGKIEQSEIKKTGGSYGELRDKGWGWNTEPPKEVHHMPADSSSNLERHEGPAIVMDYEDHKQTASCGSSREAKEYRAAQKNLIDQGKFKEALQMDIDDIHNKFGDKYDEAISQMLEYVDKLEKSGKI